MRIKRVGTSGDGNKLSKAMAVPASLFLRAAGDNLLMVMSVIFLLPVTPHAASNAADPKIWILITFSFRFSEAPFYLGSDVSGYLIEGCA